MSRDVATSLDFLEDLELYGEGNRDSYVAMGTKREPNSSSINCETGECSRPATRLKDPLIGPPPTINRYLQRGVLGFWLPHSSTPVPSSSLLTPIEEWRRRRQPAPGESLGHPVLQKLCDPSQTETFPPFPRAELLELSLDFRSKSSPSPHSGKSYRTIVQATSPPPARLFSIVVPGPFRPAQPGNNHAGQHALCGETSTHHNRGLYFAEPSFSADGDHFNDHLASRRDQTTELNSLDAHEMGDVASISRTLFYRWRRCYLRYGAVKLRPRWLEDSSVKTSSMLDKLEH